MFDYAVDTGNKQIKTKHHTFISGLTEQDTIPAMVSDTDYIRYGGKYYVLSNRREAYQRDKSLSDQYFLLVLMGLVKELEDAEAAGTILYQKGETVNVNLLCGLPPAHMGDAKLKQNFKNYFKTQEPVKVAYRGRTWMVKISRINVYVQCYAAVMTIFAKIKDYPNVLGLDIGGLTADYILLKRGRIYDLDNTDSLENGVIILYQKIKRECMKKFDALIEENDVDEIIAGNTGMYEKGIVMAVEKMAQDFVNNLLAGFRECQIDLKHTKVVFMGGGSVLLRKYIERSPLIKEPLFIEDVKANVEGYELLYRISRQKG